MNGNLSFSLFSLLLLTGCSLDVNDSDPQLSRDISQSRKDGVFIAEYKIVQRPEHLFEFTDAWQEKTSFNEIVNLFRHKRVVKTKTCDVVLSNHESSNAKYRIADMYEKWELMEVATQKSLGASGKNLCVVASI